MPPIPFVYLFANLAIRVPEINKWINHKTVSLVVIPITVILDVSTLLVVTPTLTIPTPGVLVLHN